jgi:ferredoxin
MSTLGRLPPLTGTRSARRHKAPGVTRNGPDEVTEGRMPATAGSSGLEVWIDQDLCTGDGICAEYAREVFELDVDGLAYVKGGDGQLRRGPCEAVPVPSTLIREVMDSARKCPGQCIYTQPSP